MERKIGEIFEYNGEWYQCVGGKVDSCNGCHFFSEKSKCYNSTDDNFLLCSNYNRKDKTPVIFKKLEKVGEPFLCNYYCDDRLIMMQEYRVYENIIIFPKGVQMYITDEKHKRVAIAIKQNQEDMGTRKIKLIGNDVDYLQDKLEAILHDYNCMEQAENIVDSFFSYFEREGKSNCEKLLPFDLEAAKAGKPVCTRDGRKARIICFDAKRKNGKRIIALIPSKDFIGFEDLIDYPDNGNYGGGHENDGDLMMLPEKHEGWVNLWKYDKRVVHSDGNIYSSKEEAIVDSNKDDNYIATVKISWEE